MVHTRRLTDADRIELIDLFAKGYTVRRIREHLTEKLGGSPTDQQLMQLATLYADDIDGYRRQLSKDTLSRGLAIKSERIRRLAELAETWETKAQLETKSAGVYLSALKQIQSETDAIGFTGVLPEDDKWGQLLLSLRDKVKQESNRPLTSGDAGGDGDGGGNGTS